MARIYNPQLQGVAQVRTPASNPLAGFGDLLSAISAEDKSRRFAIDTANFEMKQIDSLLAFEEGGQYDPNTGKDLFGGQPIDTSLPEMAMTKYNEEAAEIESKYGEVGKAFVAKHKVGHYGRVVNSYASMRMLANANYMEDMAVTLSNSVESGSMTFQDARGTAQLLLNTTQLPPQSRDSLAQGADDMLTHSMFKRDLKSNPELAVQRTASKYYAMSSSPRVQNAIESEAKTYLMGRAMTEKTAAENAASVSFRHNQDAKVIKMLEDFGMQDVAAEVKASQAKAARRDFYGSQNLNDSKILIANRINEASKSNNPEAMRLAYEDMKALEAREELVKQNPTMALENEGKEVSRVPVDHPAYVQSRRQIRLDAAEKFGVKSAFFGDGDAAMISQAVTQAPVNQRAGFVMALAGGMNESEQQDATNELISVNKNLGVVMSLAPRGDMVDSGVKLERMDIATAVLSPADKDYLPSDNTLKTYFSEWDSGVNWGDPAAKDAAKEAAVSAYTYYARRDGKNLAGKDVDKEIMDSVMDRITGGKLEFGKGKSTNFMLDGGKWADTEKAKTSLEAALDAGVLPDVYNEAGEPLGTSDLKKYGELVPSGQNGVYYVRRRNTLIGDLNTYEYYQNESGSPYSINMKEIYSESATQKTPGTTNWRVHK